MGMYQNLKDIVRVFRYDETLLRLLYYPIKDITSNTKDPLDNSLQDILRMSESTIWEIRDKSIFLTSKSDDLELEPLCRIYLYAGRRRSDRNSYIMASQEITVDIFCHSEFEKDLRSLRISDRINELLVDERITGFGKIEYVSGYPIQAPNDYVAYRHIYEFGSSNSW